MERAVKKLAFVIPSFGRGGAQWHLVRDVNGLVRRGYQASVIVIDADTEMAAELVPGVTIYMLAGHSLSAVTLVKFLLKLREIDADLVIGWSIYANLIVGIAQIVGAARRTLVVENNYLPLVCQLMSPVRAFVVKRAVHYIYRRVSMVAGNSNEILNYVKRSIRFGPRFARVYNPIDFDNLFSKAAERVDMPTRREGETIIVAAGRMWEYQKGFDILLNACARLRNHPAPWNLWMLGDGGDLPKLKALADDLGLREQVAWFGMQSNPFPFYRAADIIVLSSRFEGFPNVVLEAMALGKATISSDCMTGPRELTCDGKYGILVPVGDDRVLSEAIAALMTDVERRKELGKSAARHVASAYGEDRVFSQLVRVVEDAAN